MDLTAALTIPQVLDQDEKANLLEKVKVASSLIDLKGETGKLNQYEFSTKFDGHVFVFCFILLSLFFERSRSCSFITADL